MRQLIRATGTRDAKQQARARYPESHEVVVVAKAEQRLMALRGALKPRRAASAAAGGRDSQRPDLRGSTAFQNLQTSY